MEQKAFRWGAAVGALAGVETAVFLLAPREEAALLATLLLIFAAFVAAAVLRFHLFIPEAGETRQAHHPYFRSYPSLRA